MLLECVGMSRGSYLYQKRIAPSKAYTIKYKEQIEAIKEIHKDSKERYGYRRIGMVLDKKDLHLNHKTLHAVMRKLNIQGIYRKSRRKYSSYQGTVGKIAPNLLNRNYTPAVPLTSFATDVSEFAHPDGKLYLSPIIDMCTNEVVAFDVAESPSMQQISRMLTRFDKLLKEHNVKDAMVHSDQGWQYQQRGYVNWLKEHSLIQSMSRKATTADNIMIEIFFGRMKVEMFYGKENSYETKEDLKQAIKNYIKWYNKERVCQKLKGMSPIEFRNHALYSVRK